MLLPNALNNYAQCSSPGKDVVECNIICEWFEYCLLFEDLIPRHCGSNNVIMFLWWTMAWQLLTWRMVTKLPLLYWQHHTLITLSQLNMTGAHWCRWCLTCNVQYNVNLCTTIWVQMVLEKKVDMLQCYHCSAIAAQHRWYWFLERRLTYNMQCYLIL